MQDPKCIQCDSEIKVYKQTNNIKCLDCGAYYTIITQSLKEDHLECQYRFMGFNCIYSGFMNKCDNTCPSAHMFCEEHVTDKFIIEAKKNIQNNENKVQVSKNTLDIMYESKKTWMVGKMSGI